jgi:CheY-like chemotaxis protein
LDEKLGFCSQVRDGIETMQRIAQIPNASRIPIIALTALAMPGDRECCLAASATLYMSKPFSLAQLRLTSNNLLST